MGKGLTWGEHSPTWGGHDRPWGLADASLARTLGPSKAILEFSGIFWIFLEFSGIFWNFLEFSGIFWNFLEFSGIFWHARKSRKCQKIPQTLKELRNSVGSAPCPPHARRYETDMGEHEMDMGGHAADMTQTWTNMKWICADMPLIWTGVVRT